MSKFASGQTVYHPDFGRGYVEVDKSETVLVRFEHGYYEECLPESLTVKTGIAERIENRILDNSRETLLKVIANAITSVNDTWGVFSKSRITLLPHQLWVCHRVLRNWPARCLVADDVGLGKTIEAGLMLWPLISKGRVKRLLILCPAALVEQWQYRLKDMFDIRLARYLPEADTPRVNFWNTQNQVVASLQTLRDDHKKRHERLFAAEPWDLLIVDEAHHLNFDENTGTTLGYRLVEKLIRKNLVQSRIFFTGTPHRGKDYAFLALLRLLEPELFSLKIPLVEQLGNLRKVVIRNNKQNVTDMTGKKLFQPVKVYSETFTYSPEEAYFYSLLTDFIATGKTYAITSLSDRNRRAVMLVLISMQKLASSSIAAIKKALLGRLKRLRQSGEKLREAKKQLEAIKDVTSRFDTGDDLSLTDELQKQEELISELSASLPLMEDEITQLEILVKAAETVTRETKIGKILEILNEKYQHRSVLFFTEYKATQALLLSELMRKYGEKSVTFINGDNRLEGIVDAHGNRKTIAKPREQAAADFNAGKVRFLISTEAAGEGIDLQESCHSLIHVDLPWNPMRLHQRVGRLNRYGQKYPVEVATLRNPETVEARIWNKLNEKINRIMIALGSAMDDPEDLLQLVLGMTSSSLFTELFADAPSVAEERLDEWFDAKTKTFGGRDALQAVKNLVGNCSSFDYQDLDDIPRKDLPDLQIFFENMLSYNKRKIFRSGNGMSFKTPDVWLNDAGVKRRYEGVVFSRGEKSYDASLRVMGVGHRAFDQALAQAEMFDSQLSKINGLKNDLLIFSVFDRVTTHDIGVEKVILGYEAAKDRVVLDWELIDILNDLLNRKNVLSANESFDQEQLRASLQSAEKVIREKINTNNIPFKVPEIRPLAILLATD